MFGGELDILELRLSVLSSVVDQFVVVEGTRTFSGASRPLVMEANWGRFAAWRDRIIYVEVDDLPPPKPSRWAVEVWLRNCLLRGLGSLGPADTVVIADVDEIPLPWAVERAADLLTDSRVTSVAFELTTSCFKGDLIVGGGPISVTKAYRRETLACPHHQRYFVSSPVTIHSAGRHLSSMLSPQEVHSKLRNFGHSERDNVRDNAIRHLERCQYYAIDVLGQGLLEPSTAVGDEILARLKILRPDLMLREPLPPRRERLFYLRLTRLRRCFSAEGRVVAALDRRLDGPLVRITVALSRPAVALWQRIVEHRRFKRNLRWRSQLGFHDCTVEEPCYLCIGQVS